MLTIFKIFVHFKLKFNSCKMSLELILIWIWWSGDSSWSTYINQTMFGWSDLVKLLHYNICSCRIKAQVLVNSEHYRSTSVDYGIVFCMFHLPIAWYLQHLYALAILDFSGQVMVTFRCAYQCLTDFREFQQDSWFYNGMSSGIGTSKLEVFLHHKTDLFGQWHQIRHYVILALTKIT